MSEITKVDPDQLIALGQKIKLVGEDHKNLLLKNLDTILESYHSEISDKSAAGTIPKIFDEQQKNMHNLIDYFKQSITVTLDNYSLVGDSAISQAKKWEDNDATHKHTMNNLDTKV